MLSISKLDRSQIRVMLTFCGCPIKEQPKKTSDAKSLLSSFEKIDPEQYNKIYNIVILNKTEESDVKNFLTATDATEIISSEIDLLKKSAVSELENRFKKESDVIIEEVREALKIAIAKEADNYKTIKHIVYTNDKPTKEIKGVVCEDFGVLLQLAQERVNTLMVGASGCGKTHVAAQLAEAMDLPFASQSCSAGVSESAFTGKLLPLGDHGKFEYVESDFVRIYERGGVFLFDEIDAADANVLVFLNQALANDGFHCSQRISNTVVKKHKDFIAIAAANTFGQGADSLYTGRNSLDAATLDRFRMGTVKMDYSAIIEEQIVDSEVLDYGRKMRRLIEDNNLMKIVSTRFMKDATAMKTNQNWTMERIQDMYLADWSREEIAVIGGKLSFERKLSKEDTEKLLKELKEDEAKNGKVYGNAFARHLISIGGNSWIRGDKNRIYLDDVIQIREDETFYYNVTTRRFSEYGTSKINFKKYVALIESTPF